METTTEASREAAPQILSVDMVPTGTPLEWPIADASDHALLYDRGAILLNDAERRFLFDTFKPIRGDDLEDAGASPASADNQAAKPDSTVPLTVKDMHLAIGGLLGLRSQVGGGTPMQPCRIIGFAPNESIFITPPMTSGRPVPLAPGENVEIVAIASQAVFRFVCTVDAVCQLPFDYVVLSRPGVIRRLRERKSIRVRTRLAVRYGLGVTGDSYDGVALATGISALGISLSAPLPLGQVGDRVRVSFGLKSPAPGSHVETTAIVRNVQRPATPDGLTMHGMEFDQLDTVQQMALKVFVFDRQDDVQYWSNPTR
ncbi:flagellar brake protein [Paraburkholderia sp.]|uniref:flagellar brake protein n=1 Tax=Paraburkholderia sp. TaxID=1926495 RepID=UPI00238F1B66|nr:flagellar brake protein [Paraburkholderia sp.]MDE1182530.1 flagellar brake protein [Paraburkholderia sp.]